MTILDRISEATFIKEYWQQKPLLIRGALKDWSPPLSKAALIHLAEKAEVESRLVQNPRGQDDWSVEFGPFDQNTFANLPSTHWSLLIQGCDLWHTKVAALKSQFAFLPSWRLDDIMVSFAPKHGGVGPHFDQYDVFLIQGEGRRQWQLGDACNAETPTQPDLPLKILSSFSARETYDLETGDLLYVPPGIAHWGTALEDCTTYSVGFRAPSLSEVVSDLAEELIAEPESAVYRDPKAFLAAQSDAIEPAHILQIQEMLSLLSQDTDRIADWFARYMTRPKFDDVSTPINELREARVGDQRYRNGEKVEKISQ